MAIPKDLTGQKFNRLLVLSMAIRTTEKDRIRCNCICDCGKETIVESVKLKNGHTKSCGCYKKELTQERNKLLVTTHGLSQKPIYYIWQNMIARCHNSNYQSYHRYGARGIKVCKTWRYNFIAFCKWATANGWEKGLQIDRYPNNKGDYKPSNCRIVTGKINSNNRTNTAFVTWNGVTKCASEWAEITGISNSVISKRVKDGLTGENAIYGNLYVNRKTMSAEKKRALNLRIESRKKLKLKKQLC